MNIDPAVLNELIWRIGIMSAVIAAGISAVFQLINGWRERLSADKRHLRDLALRAAIVQWEYDVAQVKAKNADIMARRTDERIPDLTEVHFDMILVRKLKLIETFGKPNLSKKDVERGIREMGIIVSTIKKETHPKNKV